MIQTAHINLYHGDCLTAMREMEDNAYDLAIVDPPYGIGRDGKPKSTSKNGGHKGYKFKGWDKEAPSAEYFKELFRVSKNQIVWGANYYPEYFKRSPGWILWDKGQRIDQADGELAFSSVNKPLRIFTCNRVQIQLDGAIHPTQKPVKLYKWILKNYANPGDKILDTHGGSMSIAIACWDMGYDLDLWELDLGYFQKGKKRFDQHASQQILFQPEASVSRNDQIEKL